MKNTSKLISIHIFAIVMAIAMVFSLTACGSETAPETTVAPTNENSTEAVNACETAGHIWVSATCSIAKTCSVCGKTEGEALDHVWIDATYEAPKTCETCGTTEGEALIAYFAEHGLDVRLLDKSGEYDFEQTCGSDTTKTTILKVTVEDYRTIASDETHEALDGYEWRVMSINMHLYDENAQQYGINTWNYIWCDFYANEPADVDGDTTGLFENGMAYPITCNGVAYADGLLHIAESVGAWEQDESGNNYLDIVVTVSVRVPVAYDGFVFCLEAYGWEMLDGKYPHEIITDNTLMFRMD